jgi:N-formylglutamate deformylase
MKSSFIIVHIPHSSLKLPHSFWRKTIMNKHKIKNENIYLADLYVHKLFNYKKAHKLKFNYSRMFCDVERFRDDHLEVMTKLHMGVIYTHTSDQEKFIDINPVYKNFVLENYYDQHHQKLNEMCDKVLHRYKKCLIIDLHSFSDSMVKKILNKENNPDICIGTEEGFIDQELTQFTKQYFEKKGYCVAINYPYSGSMVPAKYYLTKDKRVKSLMLEINKRLYLKDDKIAKPLYKKLKKDLTEYFNQIEKNISL